MRNGISDNELTPSKRPTKKLPQRLGDKLATDKDALVGVRALLNFLGKFRKNTVIAKVVADAVQTRRNNRDKP